MEYGFEMAKKNGFKKIKVQASLNAKDFYEKYGFVEVDRITVERGGQKLLIVVMEHDFK